MPCAPDRSRKESTQVMLRRTCFVTEKPEPRMHPIRLRSFKLAALGTYARCGLRQPLVSNMRHIHPAQPTSLTTTSCTTARPRSPRRRSGPPVRPSSYRPQCSLAHRFACRPSRFSRLTRAAWAHISQRREGPRMCSSREGPKRRPKDVLPRERALSWPSCAGRQRCAPPRRGWRPWSPGARPWPWQRRVSWWSQEP